VRQHQCFFRFRQDLRTDGAPFLPDICQGRGVVDPAQDGPRPRRLWEDEGQEVPYGSGLQNIDMATGSDGVPLALVKMTLVPYSVPSFGRVRSDLKVAVFRCQMPQGGAALSQGQLDDPVEISLGQLAKRHCLQKILFRLVHQIQIDLNPPSFQPKERNCLAEGRYEACQNHHLTTGWGCQAQEDLGLRMQGIHLGLGDAEKRSQGVPVEA
jgi:hypothetical protein